VVVQPVYKDQKDWSEREEKRVKGFEESRAQRVPVLRPVERADLEELWKSMKDLREIRLQQDEG